MTVSAVLVVLAACSGGGPAPAPRASPAAPSESSGPPASGGATALDYVAGSTVHRLELDRNRDLVVARLGSPEAVAAPYGDLLATTGGGPPGGETDFVARPRLAIVSPSSTTRLDLGPGLSPVWDAGGRRLAWLRPTGARACDSEECSGALELMSLDMTSGRSRRLLGAGRWGLLTWAGDRILVSDGGDLGHTLSVDQAGGIDRLPVPPAQVWGASPDGRWLVRVGPSTTQLIALRSGRPTGRTVSVGRGPLRLASGAWTRASTAVAAVELRSSRSGVPSTRLVTFSPDDPRPRPLDGTAGATGQVVWAPDGASLAFAQASGARGGRLRARLCRVGGAVSCRSLFSWRQGVVLLGLR